MALKFALASASVLLTGAHAMTVEDMLAAPRRSAAIVNPTGEWAAFSSSTYNWTTHKASTTWQLLNVASGNVTEAPFDSEVSEFVWIGPTDTSILYINGTNDNIPGGVTLYTADVADKEFSPTLVGSLNAPFTGLKAAKTESGDINFVVNTLAWWNGSAYNEETATKARSSGQVFDSNWIRHWNVYMTEQRYAVFGGVLSGSNGSLSLQGEPKNLLHGIKDYLTRPETPIVPGGDPGDYEISPDGKKVAFLTKAPELPKANYTAGYIYVVPHDASSAPVAINGPGSSRPEAAKGASISPRWSPDSTKVAYAQQDGISYESDRYKLYVASVDGNSSKITPIAENWDSSPSTILWISNGTDLWVISELHAAQRLWVVPANAEADFKPKNITGPQTSVADFALLPSGQALVSASSSWTSRIFYTVSAATTADTKVLLSAHTVDPELASLGPERTSNFWLPNEDGNLIQTFVYYPPNFTEEKQWPAILIPHGGPQVAMGDVWSTRWNLQLWAEQGFVVFVPQFTGTPSYSQNFTDAITNNWGGTPYRDLAMVWDHVEKNISYVDNERAACAGASFGGFMTNFIQGHDLGRKFKALVTHDGKTTQEGSYATEELYFIQHDQNGTIWDDYENYQTWNPVRDAKNWATPHFIIHNDLDYRVVFAEGMSAFNILQSLGVPSRFLHFPDEGHHVLNRENSKVWHDHIFNWMRYWVGLDEELISEGVIHQ
ncbi:unnamed protein product [Periconia digitata]|uniref:Dipeptidyl-peptidase V n=1 Tax=Periconia digitata TaxID=1303443 RepID=A0A9W4XXH6_9PLEO|nr:unnamed protein product [Periconia digitata]